MPKLQLDLLDPELYRSDPHELWTQLRAEEPVYRDDANDLWALTKHRDVLEAERPTASRAAGRTARTSGSRSRT